MHRLLFGSLVIALGLTIGCATAAIDRDADLGAWDGPQDDVPAHRALTSGGEPIVGHVETRSGTTPLTRSAFDATRTDGLDLREMKAQRIWADTVGSDQEPGASDPLEAGFGGTF